MQPLSVEILLIDHSPGDVRLIKELFRDLNLVHTVHVVEDGVKAMQYLNRQGEYANAKRPDLIFLEPVLPRKDGYELFREMQQSPALRDIPVVLFLGSEAEHLYIKTLDVKPYSYATKPLDVNTMMNIIQKLPNINSLSDTASTA